MVELKTDETPKVPSAPPIATGTALAQGGDGRIHIVLLYNTDTVQLSLDLGPHEEAVNHIPLGEGIRQAAAKARRDELGLVEAKSMADIPAAFRRQQ